MMPVVPMPPRSKVLFCTQFFPARSARNRTGGIISNMNLLRSLAGMADIRILSFDTTSSSRDFEGEPFSVIHRPAPAWRALAIFRHWMPFVRAEVGSALGHEGVMDGVMATTSTLAAFDAVPAGVKRIAIIQAFENFGFNCQWVPLRTRITLGKGTILRKFQDRRLLHSVDAILTNSRFMQRAISERFGIDQSRIHILPQQVDVMPLPANVPQGVIGFVHRGPDKNIALVCSVARLAPDLKFLVFGHDSDLPEDLPSNVEVKGWRSDQSEMFASAALWLVPSLWAEPFGRVSIEAQAAERAVLVADCGGLPETVLDDRFLLPGYDPREWLNRIRLLLEIPRKELADNGAQIRSKFSPDAHDACIINTLSSILKS